MFEYLAETRRVEFRVEPDDGAKNAVHVSLSVEADDVAEHIAKRWPYLVKNGRDIVITNDPQEYL